jgi:hypothetical protein
VGCPRRTVVFCGPSIPSSERNDLLAHAGGRPLELRPLELRPPARRGDLAHLDLSEVGEIVLVDGTTIADPPPSPSEVASVLGWGVPVWGAAGLGALRAVELRWLGMRGYGWVYERVLDGSLTYDDEVVAPVDPRTGDASGVFLVNLRYALEHSGFAEAFGAAAAGQVFRAAAGVPVLERRADRLARAWSAVEVPAGWCERLLAPAYDIKRQDALGAVRCARGASVS